MAHDLTVPAGNGFWNICRSAQGILGETWQLLDHAPIERQAEIFSFYPLTKQAEMVGEVGRDRMSKLVEVMSPDDRVDLLKRLDPAVVESLMPLIAKAERQDIRMLLSCPEGSAGSVMTTEYATVPADATVEKAIALLRQQAPASCASHSQFRARVFAHAVAREPAPVGKTPPQAGARCPWSHSALPSCRHCGHACGLTSLL